MSAAQEVAVPAQHGVGGDDQVELAELDAGEAMQQRGEQHPVGPGQLWLVHLSLPHGDLVAKGEDLQISRPITHRQQAYEAEGGRQGEVWQGAAGAQKIDAPAAPC
ncbi:hypothetical protein [Streptomyces sp. NPDC002619]|uniref:hypothetical protein n=1 Tax=Streptomyces sp. NPDC002619 TaxID=3364655 RepID=UPI0036B64753